MENPLERFAVPALHRCGVEVWLMPEKDLALVPLGALRPDTEPLLLTVHADEEDDALILQVELCVVPPAHRAVVALCLVEFNASSRFVMFSMTRGGIVLADVTVELADSRDPERRIIRAFGRLLSWIEESHGDIIGIARHGRRRLRTRLEREVEEILTNTEAEQ